MDDFNHNATGRPLTKKQRRQLKKLQREKERLALVRHRKIKKMIWVLLSCVLVVGGITISLLHSSPKETHSGMPKIEIPHKEYDAGTVSMAGGKIKHTYEIKNTGTGDLKIESIWTSCHCTTARLTISGKTSPEFGMIRRFTSQKIHPGETGLLEVTFDPAFHGPQGTGPVVRTVYLSTNDPQNKKVEVRLMADVVE